MDLGCYNSYIEVDLGAVAHNIRTIEEKIGADHQVIAVVKANAYGAGAVGMAEFLTNEMGIKTLACAQVLEGVTLRTAGIRQEILVLGAVPQNAVQAGVEHDLQLVIFNEQGAKLINQHAEMQGKIVKCQIKIETGMNRIGVRPGKELEKLIGLLRELKNIKIVGTFTHFSSAGIVRNPFTIEQNNIFMQGVEQLKAENFELEYIHCCNSAAIQWLKEGYNTHVRAGSLYMGYSDMDDGTNPFGVRPCMTWRAFVTNVHTINKGESCGYSRHYMAERETKVATVDFGYADGFFRPMLMKGGPVMLNESSTKYLATCMDQTFVDATGIDCKIGDEVTIFGYTRGGKYLSPNDFEKYGQGYVTFLCGPNHRVKRIYKR